MKNIYLKMLMVLSVLATVVNAMELVPATGGSSSSSSSAVTQLDWTPLDQANFVNPNRLTVVCFNGTPDSQEFHHHQFAATFEAQISPEMTALMGQARYAAFDLSASQSYGSTTVEGMEGDIMKGKQMRLNLRFPSVLLNQSKDSASPGFLIPVPQEAGVLYLLRTLERLTILENLGDYEVFRNGPHFSLRRK